MVAAGGTAGHVVPAMAVAAELRKSGAEVSFLGTRDKMEAELVPAAGYEIDSSGQRDRPTQPPEGGAGGARGGRRGRRGAVGAAAAARRRGDGGGGFVAGPAGLAATLTARRLY